MVYKGALQQILITYLNFLFLCKYCEFELMSNFYPRYLMLKFLQVCPPLVPEWWYLIYN